MTLPIIKLELDHMKQAILHVFSERMFALDAQVSEALDKYLETNNVQRIVDKAVFDATDHIIKEESEHFFRYGAGAKAIRESIREALTKEAKP